MWIVKQGRVVVQVEQVVFAVVGTRLMVEVVAVVVAVVGLVLGRRNPCQCLGCCSRGVLLFLVNKWRVKHGCILTYWD